MPSIHTILPRIVQVTFGAAVAIIAVNVVFAFNLDDLPQWALSTFGTGEQNILTWLSSALLLFCALLLVGLGLESKQREAPMWRRWIELAAIFFLLSLDETAELHEYLTGLIKGAYKVEGYLYFAWVIPGAGFTLLVFLRSLGLLRTLPAATRRGMLTAGALYLAGAIGIESVGANYSAHSGQVQDLTFQLLCTFEEGFEVLGLWWFLRTLLPFSADPAAAASEEERQWGRLGLDLGRAAAIGAAIAAVAALLAPQLVKLDPLKVPEMIEAEALPRAGARGCRTSLARIKPKLIQGNISQNSVLKLVPAGPQPEQSFTLEAPRPGAYRLELFMVRHRIFGEVAVLLNGKPLQQINLFAPTNKITASGPIDLGRVELAQSNTLTLRLLLQRRHYAFDGLRLTPWGRVPSSN